MLCSLIIGKIGHSDERCNSFSHDAVARWPDRIHTLAASAQTGEEWLRSKMGGEVRADVTWQEVERGIMRAYRSADVDGNGITPADHELLDQLALAAPILAVPVA